MTLITIGITVQIILTLTALGFSAAEAFVTKNSSITIISVILTFIFCMCPGMGIIIAFILCCDSVQNIKNFHAENQDMV